MADILFSIFTKLRELGYDNQDMMVYGDLRYNRLLEQPAALTPNSESTPYFQPR